MSAIEEKEFDFQVSQMQNYPIQSFNRWIVCMRFFIKKLETISNQKSQTRS